MRHSYPGPEPAHALQTVETRGLSSLTSIRGAAAPAAEDEVLVWPSEAPAPLPSEVQAVRPIDYVSKGNLSGNSRDLPHAEVPEDDVEDPSLAPELEAPEDNKPAAAAASVDASLTIPPTVMGCVLPLVPPFPPLPLLLLLPLPE